MRFKAGRRVSVSAEQGGEAAVGRGVGETSGVRGAPSAGQAAGTVHPGEGHTSL